MEEEGEGVLRTDGEGTKMEKQNPRFPYTHMQSHTTLQTIQLKTKTPPATSPAHVKQVQTPHSHPQKQ